MDHAIPYTCDIVYRGVCLRALHTLLHGHTQPSITPLWLMLLGVRVFAYPSKTHFITMLLRALRLSGIYVILLWLGNDPASNPWIDHLNPFNYHEYRWSLVYDIFGYWSLPISHQILIIMASRTDKLKMSERWVADHYEKRGDGEESCAPERENLVCCCVPVEELMLLLQVLEWSCDCCWVFSWCCCCSSSFSSSMFFFPSSFFSFSHSLCLLSLLFSPFDVDGDGLHERLLYGAGHSLYGSI